MFTEDMDALYTNTGRPDPPGIMEDDDNDDYENTAPPYKDLPPKPGSMPPPRPPRAGELGLGAQKSSALGPGSCSPSSWKNLEDLPLPPKPLKTTGLDLPPVTCPSRQSGVDLEPPPFQPSLTTTPVSWIHTRSRGSVCHQEDRLTVALCLLAATSLLLSSVGLAVTVIKYQEVAEKLRLLSLEQMSWREHVTGMAGLAGLKMDIDHVRANVNQSLVELRGLLDCSRVTCPDGWVPFEGKCYYFSSNTKSWDDARSFCQESYSHLVIIDSFAEHNFVTKTHGSPRVYWLGLNDKEREGDWRWLDGSPVTLSFWDPQEPNNIQNEDCASMNKGGTWNDLSCAKTTYWICERKCSC
ncbi:C-type lectin domain family 17, member A [Castor canadensis]|uniref:C-type lectin domain family 17, member A n=1 Tax=Castor canadensis TaxID=51338 RepID=A0AC58KYS1_CASCN